MPSTTSTSRSTSIQFSGNHPESLSSGTHDLNRRVAKQGSAIRDTLMANVLIIVNTVLRASSTLILMPLMVVILGRENYGLWITISTVTMYLSLSESGLGQTVVNKIGSAHAAGQFSRISEIIASAHVLYWIFVASVGAIALVLIQTLPIADLLLSKTDAHYESLLRTCLTISTVLALARIPMLVFPGLLIGIRKLPLRVSWEIGGVLFTLLATVVALYSGAGLIGITIVVNLSLLLSTAAICISSARCGNWARLQISQFRPSLLGSLATNSSFFFLISAAGVLDRSIPSLLVPRFVSLAATPPFFLLTSIFRVAVFSLIAAMPRAVQPYVVMWSANQDIDRLRSAAKLLTKVVTVLSTLIVALFVPYTEEFVNFWLGDACYPGNGVLALIVGAFLIDAIYATSTYFLIAMNRQRKLSLLLFFKALLTAMLAICFAVWVPNPLLGISAGAFVASVLSGLIIPLLIRPALEINWKTYSIHFLIRPLTYALLLPSLVALTTLPLTHVQKPAVMFMLLGAGCWAGWKAVLDTEDRALVITALARLRLTKSMG